MSKLYTASKYNYTLNLDDGSMILYNTKSGAIDVVEQENCDLVNKILVSPNNYTDEPIFDIINKQGYTVSSDKDELKEIVDWCRKSNSAAHIAHLTIIPTETCNFTCPYCFIYTFRDQHMKSDVYDSIYKYIQKHFEKNKTVSKCWLEISWFGGEPLLQSEQIINFMQRIQELILQYDNIVFKSGIVTNGFFLDYNLFKRLQDVGIEHFQVTLDGDAENHDKLRTLSNKKPTWLKIYNNLLEIVNNVPLNINFDMHIRGNFLRSTISNMETLLELYKKDFAHDPRFKIYFRPVYSFETERNDIEEVESDICTHQEGVAIQNRLNFTSLEGTNNKLIRITNPLPEPTFSWCTTIKRNSHIIGYDGSIFSCDTMLTEKDKAVGALNQSGDIELNENAKIWKGTVFDQMGVIDNKIINKCMQCRLLPVCVGGCNRARLTNNQTPCFFDDNDIYNSMREYAELSK